MFRLRLKEFRKLRNLTQQELAQKAKVSQEYISDLEKLDRSKSPTLKVVRDISKALDICVYELLAYNCPRYDECTSKCKNHSCYREDNKIK